MARRLGVSFIGRRRGAGGGAGTGKNAWHARHTMAAAARRALTIFARRLAIEVKAWVIRTTREDSGAS